MSIIVLTYQVAHRKTYDTLCLLKVQGYSDVIVYATPLKYKKSYQPLIEHRPDMFFGIPEIAKVCGAFDYSYVEQPDYGILVPERDDVVLVCGAGLLPDRLVATRQVVNAHPGLIPYSRGLDALKWAIWADMPIGVSTHVIGPEIDAGEIIDRREVSVNNNDTILSLGLRVYSTEIDMLVEAVTKIHEPHLYVSGEDYPVHRRMPHEIEAQLSRYFDARKANLDGIQGPGRPVRRP